MGERNDDAQVGASGLPRRFRRSAASNYALTAVLMAVALVTTPILTKHLGPQRYGIWVFVGSAIAYVQLLDLGFGGAVVAAVARLSASGDDATIARTLNSAFFLLTLLGLIALPITAIAAAFLPSALHVGHSLANTTRILLVVLGLNVALSVPLDTFGCGLVALQRFDLLNATLIGVAAGEAVAWVVVLSRGGGLIELGVITVVISLVGQLVRYLMLRRLVPDLTISFTRVDREVVRTLASPAGWFALGDTIEGLRDYASVLVLGLVRTVSTAGVFAIGEKLATLGTKLGTPLIDPFFPHASELVGSGDDNGLGVAARTGNQLTAGATVPCCLIVGVLARPALLAWVGPTYERATTAVVILAVAFGLRSLGTAPARVLSGAGGQRMLALVGVVEVGTQVALTAVFGILFGLVGVAAAILTSVIGIELAVRLPMVARRLRTGVLDLVRPVLRAHVPALAVSGVVGWFGIRSATVGFVRTHGRAADLGVVALAGLGILAVYAAAFALTGLDSTTRRRLRLRMRSPGAATPAPNGVEDAHLHGEAHTIVQTVEAPAENRT